MFTSKDTAHDILDSFKKTYSGAHEYRLVNASDFRHLDLELYDSAMTGLSALGFRFEADVENLTLKSGAMDPRTFLRLGIAKDNLSSSAIFQIKPRIWWRIILRLTGIRMAQVTEFSTEFADGTFVETSNAQHAGMIDSPPQVRVVYLSADSSLESSYATHRAAVEEHAYVGNTTPIQYFSFRDVLASQHRMEEIKADFRKRVGWIKKSEWDRMAGKPDSISDRIYDEFRVARDHAND